MEIFLGWLLFTSVQLAATMSPGPAFVVSVRNSMAYGRRIGILTAFGLALGVAVHVAFVLFGLSYLITKSVLMFNFIKYVGAVYLIYIGVKALMSGKSSNSLVDDDIRDNCNMSIRSAIFNGFLTNLFNPKAVIFFTAVFLQFIDEFTPLSVSLLYGFISVSIEFLWFSFLSILLTNSLIKKKFKNVMHVVERLCGGLMVALGLKLALIK